MCIKNKQQCALSKGVEEIRKRLPLILRYIYHIILCGFNATRPVLKLGVYIGMSERNHYVAHVGADKGPE
jgi:hypothetical protein